MCVLRADGMLLCSQPESILWEEEGESPCRVSVHASLTSFLILPRSGSTTTRPNSFCPLYTLLLSYYRQSPLLDYELFKNKCFILFIFAFLGLSVVPYTWQVLNKPATNATV